MILKLNDIGIDIKIRLIDEPSKVWNSNVGFRDRNEEFSTTDTNWNFLVKNRRIPRKKQYPTERSPRYSTTTARVPSK